MAKYLIDDELARRTLESLRDDFVWADRELCPLDALLVVSPGVLADPGELRPKHAYLGIEVQEHKIASGLMTGFKVAPQIEGGEREAESISYAIKLHAMPGEEGFARGCEHMHRLGSDATACLVAWRKQIAARYPSPYPMPQDWIGSCCLLGRGIVWWWIFLVHHLAWVHSTKFPLHAYRFTWCKGRRCPHPLDDRWRDWIGADDFDDVKESGWVNTWFASELHQKIFRASALAIDALLNLEKDATTLATQDQDNTGISVTEAAEQLLLVVSDITLDKAQSRVSRAANDRKFKTNGKSRLARRIDQDSFSTWKIKQLEKDLAKAH